MPTRRIINHLCVKGRTNSVNSEISFTSESKKQHGIKFLFIILKSQCTLKNMCLLKSKHQRINLSTNLAFFIEKS